MMPATQGYRGGQQEADLEAIPPSRSCLFDAIQPLAVIDQGQLKKKSVKWLRRTSNSSLRNTPLSLELPDSGALWSNESDWSPALPL